jgi:hypothetical protein
VIEAMGVQHLVAAPPKRHPVPVEVPRTPRAFAPPLVTSTYPTPRGGLDLLTVCHSFVAASSHHELFEKHDKCGTALLTACEAPSLDLFLKKVERIECPAKTVCWT